MEKRACAWWSARRVTRTLAWAAFVAGGLGASPSAQNLILNPSFEGGAAGYVSDYNFNGGPFLNPGDYFLVANPQSWNPGLLSVADHTPGNGMWMMVVDGSPGIRVWQQSVGGLSVGDAYAFRFWWMYVSQGFATPPTLEVQTSANGVAWAPMLTVTAPSFADGVWRSSYFTFVATAATMHLRIIDTAGAEDGNDFALDDLELRQCLEATVEFVVGTGINPEILTGTAPQLGSTVSWTLTDNTGGGTFGFVKGRLGNPISVNLSIGQLFLPPGPDVLGLTAQLFVGGTASFSLEVPPDPSLCGIEFTTQGIRLGGGQTTLSNGLLESVGS